MSFYGEMADVVTGLLAEFGKPITLTRTVAQSIDPVTGEVTPGMETSFAPNGVMKSYPDKAIDGTRILSGDKQLILDPSVEPLMTDVATVKGERWVIQEVEAVNPAGTPLAYKARVRK